MKTAVKILALVFFSLFIMKCENSQGYDPYATITPIYPDIPGIDTIGNSPETDFKPDSVQFFFWETYRSRGMGGRNQTVRWNYKSLRTVIILDTGNAETKVFAAMAVGSKESRSYFRMRMDWVYSFEIKFAAILDEDFYSLNRDSDSRRWFQIKIFRNTDAKILSYDPRQVSGQVIINKLDSDKGIIFGTIIIDLSKISGYKHLQLQHFKCDFRIFYTVSK